jgi:hypothetical protein
MSFGMLCMAGITLLQAVHNKSLVIVAETCMPFELGAAAIYGRLALKNAQAAFHEPIPGCNNPPLTPEPMPNPGTFARQIGLEG